VGAGRFFLFRDSVLGDGSDALLDCGLGGGGVDTGLDVTLVGCGAGD